MIREGKKLPVDVLAGIPTVITRIAGDEDVVALYAFGSQVETDLKPLSDLDFGILFSDSLDRRERFRKSTDWIGTLNEILRTDEVDLVILNDDPFIFTHNILKTGKMLYCRDQGRLIDYIEETQKSYLDFKPARDQFDRVFLRGIGYHG